VFDADRPILKNTQDRLGRAVFAKYLARCILDQNNIASMVIGLYGDSGVGKTSIINLTLEELHAAASNMLEDQKPIILNFSPWSYSGQNQLIYSFFRRLSSEIRRFPYLKNPTQIIHLLELYVSFFTDKPVPKSLRPKGKFLKKLFKPQLTKEDSYAWESGRDLTQVKAELNELLSKEKRKIIIIIDNIARLEDKEVGQIFQIVKSMGDYANTVYLLALEKERVVHALNTVYGEGGDAFLEKVVQLPFEISPISKQDLEAILLDRLKKIIDNATAQAWNKEYWADIYYSTLKYFFENCRDITRYVNTLSFSFSRIKEVVNPVDFFAMTAISVFEPHVFQGIRDNKDLFADLVENVYELDKKKLEEDKLRCEEILKRSKKISYGLLHQLLVYLFPRLRNIYKIDEKFYHSQALARQNKRICCLDLFDVYFRLSISSGYISKAEANALLALTGDTEGFALALLRLNQDDRISKFLDILDGFAIARIPLPHIGNVMNALVDSADLFPEGKGSLLNFDTPMRLHRIFHQLLNRLSSEEQRFDLFQDAIKKANKSLYIIIHEIRLQEREHNQTQSSYLPLEHRAFSPSHLSLLQKAALEKIQYWANIGRLVEHPHLLPILYAWKEWGDVQGCMRYVESIIKEPRGLLAFLGAIFKLPVEETIAKLTKNTTGEKSFKQIENFVSISTLAPYAKTLFESEEFEKLTEREQLAILIFLDLAKVNTKKMMPEI